MGWLGRGPAGAFPSTRTPAKPVLVLAREHAGGGARGTCHGGSSSTMHCPPRSQWPGLAGTVPQSRPGAGGAGSCRDGAHPRRQRVRSVGRHWAGLLLPPCCCVQGTCSLHAAQASTTTAGEISDPDHCRHTLPTRPACASSTTPGLAGRTTPCTPPSPFQGRAAWRRSPARGAGAFDGLQPSGWRRLGSAVRRGRSDTALADGARRGQRSHAREPLGLRRRLGPAHAAAGGGAGPGRDRRRRRGAAPAGQADERAVGAGPGRRAQARATGRAAASAAAAGVEAAGRG